MKSDEFIPRYSPIEIWGYKPGVKKPIPFWAVLDPTNPPTIVSGSYVGKEGAQAWIARMRTPGRAIPTPMTAGTGIAVPVTPATPITPIRVELFCDGSRIGEGMLSLAIDELPPRIVGQLLGFVAADPTATAGPDAPIEILQSDSDEPETAKPDVEDGPASVSDCKTPRTRFTPK